MSPDEPLPAGWLPKAEYHAIYARVPRVCVELVITDARGVLLAYRDDEPFRRFWHLPGGTILFGETVHEAVHRVARRELGVAVGVGAHLGFIEYPGHYEPRTDHPIGLAFAVTPAEPIADPAALASECRFFPAPPAERMHPDQTPWLIAQGIWRG